MLRRKSRKIKQKKDMVQTRRFKKSKNKLFCKNKFEKRKNNKKEKTKEHYSP